MAKRTAIIDIGSNSLSLVIYEKSSRFAFHLIEKVRASVRIGEGAYEHGGILQEEAMDKAFDALKDFLYVAENVKCRKVLCVATSALRDAPNKKLFLQRVKKELNLGIKVINGEQEAHFGAVAALNLLEPFDSFTTIDIGGGSTELAKVEGGKVIETLSLDLGTVRLKELLCSNDSKDESMNKMIKELIKQVPETFKSTHIVGIGGTIRALSSAIMIAEEYPIHTLHGFDYRVKDYKSLLKDIPSMSTKELKKLDIPSSRLDTIREGTAIFYRLLRHLDAKVVVASKAGVREGVYLSDILRNSNYHFPHNFNVSIKSLMDRFALSEKNCAYVQRTALSLFDILSPLHQINHDKREVFGFAAKLSPISKRINIYSNSHNSFYFLLENLNFTFSHKKKLLLALLLKLSSKEKQRNSDYKRYAMLLPDVETMEWFYFMLSVSECINSNRKIQDVRFSLEDRRLIIMIGEGVHLCEACLEKLPKSNSLEIVLESSS
jgi:exopolyphosphatase/guanosine-5'-triphosphate,3'-diphosphate pyrophosphatase